MSARPSSASSDHSTDAASSAAVSAARSAADAGTAITVDRLTSRPHEALTTLRAEAPVAWVDALDAWLVTTWDLAVAVLREPATFTVDDPRFSTARVIGPSMLSLDHDEHRRHRQPFQTPFRPRRVTERFEPFVVETTNRLLDAVDGHRADDGSGPNERLVDLRTALAGPLAAAVVAESLGLDGRDPTTVEALLGWYRAIVDSVSGVSAGDEITDASRDAFAELRRVVLDHLGGTRVVADSGDARNIGDSGSLPVPDDAGGASLLVEAARSGDLTDDEVVSNAAVIMFGGIETTEGMILNALWHLLTNPDALHAVVDDQSLVPDAVEESLRLEPAAAVVDRYATRDVELGDASIATGDKVTVSLAAANRDPSIFDAPDEFRIGRSNVNRHLAFAQGPHVCVGMELARLEARVAVAQVVERFPGIRLDHATASGSSSDGSDAPAAPSGLVFRKPTALAVRW